MSEREAPTNEPEADADPRVLALLQSGSPANGIDLAPWWRANAAALEAPPKPAQKSFPAWASLAAMLLLGISLGLAGSNGLFASPSKNAAACRYDAKERSTLIAVVEAESKLDSADGSPRRTALLTLCSTCHAGRNAACRYDEKERMALTAAAEAESKLEVADGSPRRTALQTLCSTCHAGRFGPSL